MTTATWHDGSQTKYTFDAGQRITQAQEFASGNPTALQTINRTYDGLDRLTQEQTGLGTVGYGYNAIDQRTSLTLPGQAGISYTWDSVGRLTQIQQATTPTARTIGFTYDNAGRRTQVTLANGLTGTYTYDNASQLTGITYLNGATSVGTLTYGFDNAGRITSQGGTLQQAFLPAATTAVAVHSATNALTSWNATALNYDNHGNLVSDGTRTYTWDVRNRLVQVNQGATVVASYTYDPYGRRIKKVVNGTTTQYVYDGANSVVEADQSGTVTAAMLSGLGMDEWYLRSAGGVTRHYLRDLIGSTRALADDAKAIQTQYQYEPYGETTASGAAYDNPFQYTGRENDGYGLYYYRARYYSPGVKRFVAEDPIGFTAGPNLYSYVGGGALYQTDPTGEIPVFVIPMVTGAIGGIAGGLGNYLAQRFWQGKCDVDWTDVINAAAWGAIGGAALPASGFTAGGAAAIGAAANLGQYFTGQILGGEAPTAGATAWNAMTGAVGGALGGAFTRSAYYGAMGTQLPQQALNSQTMKSIGANAGVGNFARNAGGGFVGNLPPTSPSSPATCGCQR